MLKHALISELLLLAFKNNAEQRKHRTSNHGHIHKDLFQNKKEKEKFNELQ